MSNRFLVKTQQNQHKQRFENFYTNSQYDLNRNPNIEPYLYSIRIFDSNYSDFPPAYDCMFFILSKRWQYVRRTKKKVAAELCTKKRDKQSHRYGFDYTIVSVDDSIICAEPKDFIVNVTNNLIHVGHMYRT